MTNHSLGAYKSDRINFIGQGYRYADLGALSSILGASSVKYQQGFTPVPNYVIRHPELSVYAKLVYTYLLSLNPAFPSYERICEALSLSRERVWKSLKELESFGAVNREKLGRNNRYKLKVYDHNVADMRSRTSTPDELIKPRPVRETNSTSSPDELKPVRETNSNKKETTKTKKKPSVNVKGLLKVIPP